MELNHRVIIQEKQNFEIPDLLDHPYIEFTKSINEIESPDEVEQFVESIDNQKYFIAEYKLVNKIFNELIASDVAQRIIDEWNLIKKSGHEKAVSSAKNMIGILSREWLSALEDDKDSNTNYDDHYELRNKVIETMKDIDGIEGLETLLIKYFMASNLLLNKPNLTNITVVDAVN
jgi:hypothetical protein